LNNVIKNKQILFSYLLWWLFWIIFQSIVLHKFGISWQLALVDSTISNFLLATAGYVILNTYRFYTPNAGNYLYRFAYIVVLTILTLFTTDWILQYFFQKNIIFIEFFKKSIPIRYMFSFLMISFLDLINWLWFYIKELDNNKQRKTDAEQLLREAELANLRQQLQPHFLFNSLNSISALAGSKPEEARKMIQQLSDFLRGTLKKDEKKPVSFSAELKHLKLYLDIEKVRFGHRLKTIINCTDEAMELELPSLLLQPLVENAIKFGLYDTIGEIEIKIEAIKLKNQLKISIENPFDSETAKPKQGTGFGLDSVSRRLYLIYSRNDLLGIERKERLFKCTIKIPQSL
jgi:two-component system, LytTR family, sensor kinase